MAGLEMRSRPFSRLCSLFLIITISFVLFLMPSEVLGEGSPQQAGGLTPEEVEVRRRAANEQAAKLIEEARARHAREQQEKEKLAADK